MMIWKKAFKPVAWLCASLALAAGGEALAAERIYMPLFEVINIHSDYQYSTARLFKSYVDDHGKYTIVLPDSLRTGEKPLPEAEVRKTAVEKNCPFYLIGDMNRISERVILHVSLYDSKSGERVWSDKLKAANPDDLDPIFQRLATAIGTPEAAAKSGDIYSVTEYEREDLKKIQVSNAFGLSLGGVGLFGDDWGEAFLGGFGIYWAYDSRDILFQIDAETYPFSELSDFKAISISVYRPFSPGRMSLFGGGGLGIGQFENAYWDSSNKKTQDTEGTGMLFEAGGGVLFNRTATVQLRLEAKLMQALFEMDNPQAGRPTTFVVKMGLAFGT